MFQYSIKYRISLKAYCFLYCFRAYRSGQSIIENFRCEVTFNKFYNYNGENPLPSLQQEGDFPSQELDISS